MNDLVTSCVNVLWKLHALGGEYAVRGTSCVDSVKSTNVNRGVRAIAARNVFIMTLGKNVRAHSAAQSVLVSTTD